MKLEHRSASGTAADLQWLRRHPGLGELIERFPDEWERVRSDVRELLSRDDEDAIKDYIARMANPEQPGRGRQRPMPERVSVEARRQMAVLMLKQEILRSSSGVKEGPIRFGFVNGYVMQRLLFRRGLERKPVRLWQFRMMWPLLTQRRRLMPLVQPEGIWAFYSAALVRELATLIAGRPTLEIAAGDGTLARFLADAGVPIVATDDHSWSHNITFTDAVARLDARSALREHQPQVVVCAWPPPGNAFEKHVFATPSVDLYIVISSANEQSAGNWDAYRAQRDFDMVHDERLSRMVLPPEVQHAVYVFKRRRSAGT